MFFCFWILDIYRLLFLIKLIYFFKFYLFLSYQIEYQKHQIISKNKILIEIVSIEWIKVNDEINDDLFN